MPLQTDLTPETTSIYLKGGRNMEHQRVPSKWSMPRCHVLAYFTKYQSASYGLRRKRRHLVVQRSTILPDNARSHTAAATDLLRRWQWEILEHPPYSHNIYVPKHRKDNIILKKMDLYDCTRFTWSYNDKYWEWATAQFLSEIQNCADENSTFSTHSWQVIWVHSIAAIK